MGLAESLSTPPSRRDNKCGTCTWIASRSEEEQAAIAAASKDPDWSQAALHRTLVDHGLVIGETQFRRHYRECSSE